jgi:hypothetical protein
MLPAALSSANVSAGSQLPLHVPCDSPDTHRRYVWAGLDVGNFPAMYQASPHVLKPGHIYS